MKRIVILFVLVSLVLAACSQQATPTASDAEMMTKVAKVLTNMPTATPTVGPKVATATVSPPTAAPTGAQKIVEPTKPGTQATSAPSSPTSKPPAVTATSTSTQAAATATKPAASNTPAGPSATPPATDPLVKLGVPTWSDKMGNGNNWPTGNDPSGYTEIAFNNGFLELTALKPIDGWRLSSERIANAYLEMTVNTGSCLAKDRYGVIVRVPSSADANRGYLFGFTCDGKFSIRKWDGTANSMTNFINWKANAAINAGADQTNRLGVMMMGNQFSLYANGVLVGQVTDNTWSEGNFGIFAGAHQSSEYTLKVDDVRFWNLD